MLNYSTPHMDASRAWLLMTAVVGIPLAICAAAHSEDAPTPSFDAQALEFFEKDVRPLLVKRCYECHGPDAKRLEGGFLMISRAAFIKGGDTGPAIVAGSAKASLLIDAINYRDPYEMPPKGKLPAEEIALLTRWVEMGAPWSKDAAGPDPRKKFDLDERKRSHWAWRPIEDPVPPAVKNKDWPLDPIDNFILARLEAEGLTPNLPADPRTLVRRLYFDIIGLPPSEEEVTKWVARLTVPHLEARPSGGDAATNNKVNSNALPDGARLNEDAIESLVDELLASPRFGERWGRHWLDLMRYAESRGHEFDYDAPDAWEYRDYVIRALNADVPYDQFVIEHVAGDLLPEARRNPDEGFNESIIATGFWHLGEWVHSPVDIRQDECDRQDNQIDTFGKTFLGMTIACARCHDHKFDAISQRDYYATAGFLQSSAYRLARFETLDHNRDIANKLHQLRQASGKEMAKQTCAAQQPVLNNLDKYLLAAREAIISPVTAAEVKPPVAEKQAPVVFSDFEDGTYGKWQVEGASFGDKPVAGTLPRQQQVSGFGGKFYVNTYIGGDGSHGKASSPPFTIKHKFITMLVGGGAHAGQTCMNLVVDAKTVRTVTGKENERLDPAAWEVADLVGKQAHLEIIDTHSAGWGHINVDDIVFTDNAAADAAQAKPPAGLPKPHVAAVAEKHVLNADVLAAWVAYLMQAKDRTDDPLHLWALLAHDTSADDQHVAEVALPIVEALARRREAGALADAEVIIDFSRCGEGQWMADGSAFGVAPLKVGEPLVSSDPAHPLAGFAAYGAARRDLAFKDLKLAPGSENDQGAVGGWQRAGQSVRTPTFTIEHGPVHYLVRGAGRAFAVVDSHRMIQGPLHGEVLFQWNDDTQGRPRWVTHNLARHQGHRAHVEFSPNGGGELEILMVAQGERAPPLPADQLATRLISDSFKPEATKSLAAITAAYQALLLHVNKSAASGFADEDESHVRDDAALADWMIKNSNLFVEAKEGEKAFAPLAETALRFFAAEMDLVGQIKKSSRVAMAMWDGSPENEQLLIRGNHGNLGGASPRRMLTALGGKDEDFAANAGSGRLDLARQIVDSGNPLTSRVMANRLWHHLTGRGIVPTTDNFGVLGLPPTHPELLDHLAKRLVREGWSIKTLIKDIALSSTYQMSSYPTEAGEQVDPANKLLHRMRIRRLEGETVRDALLAVSGRLDERMYGPPVPVFLTEFMTGRGRPGQSGPLDGGGRRSIYISIRRNFLSPMMLAFDTPQPSSTMGRRTVSNVPAQALIMMNDPLVIQEAELWAKRLLTAQNLSPEQRIERMYLQAFARPPSEIEAADALAFLAEQAGRYGIPAEQATASPQAWADLCHVMFNVKEFIFVN